MRFSCNRNTQFHFGYTVLLAIIAAALISVPCVGLVGVQYTLTDLGTLGGTTSDASAINDSGVVVGESALAGDTATHAFEYANGVMTDLGTIGGDYSDAVAINNSGIIVGSSVTARSSYTHAFAYGLSGSNVIGDLGYFGDDGDPGADFQSAALGISDNGTIIATSSYITQFSSGTYNGVTVDGPNEGPWGFNELTFAPAAISQNGRILNSAWGGAGVTPIDINDSGEIVGSTSGIAFLYTPVDGMMSLGTLGGANSVANAINDTGQVVGEAETSSGNQDAFYFDSSVGMVDLNCVIPLDSGWELVSATGINANGQIVGDGVIDGQNHAFLLSLTVPEPTCPASLFIAGLAEPADQVHPRIPSVAASAVPGKTEFQRPAHARKGGARKPFWQFFRLGTPSLPPACLVVAQRGDYGAGSSFNMAGYANPLGLTANRSGGGNRQRWRAACMICWTPCPEYLFLQSRMRTQD